MTLSAVAYPFIQASPPWLSGVMAWLALLFLLPCLALVQRIQASILFIVGVISLAWAWSRGVPPDMLTLINSNNSLLTLLAGVSFLRLVTLPAAGQDDALPRGRGAFIRTLAGTHLFSSVINLSALLIVADRLARKHRLQRNTAVPLARAFSAAAFWSPFFAAMGVALTYAPGASLPVLVLQGLPLACIALVYTFFECLWTDRDRLQHYAGYPLHFSALWIPGVLVIGVVAVHRLHPEISVLLIVASLSLLLTVLVSLLRNPREAMPSLRLHTLTGLPAMSGELALFLSAGILSAGLSGLFRSFDGLLPIAVFNFPVAASSLLAMVALSIAGIHPVISIAILGAWLAPLHPDPDLLGTVFLCSWAIGVVAAPLSGMNLALHGRYGVRGKSVIRWHYRYVLVMLLAAILLLGWYTRALD
jgi:hypothetical protein